MTETRQAPDEQRCGYRITGVVQGVGFRWWTCRIAAQLGIRGTVRNCQDGSVEAVAVGSSAALRDFQGRLHQGPPGATVRRVERFEPDKDLLANDFRIVR